jgi:hypothetical protein
MYAARLNRNICKELRPSAKNKEANKAPGKRGRRR